MQKFFFLAFHLNKGYPGGSIGGYPGSIGGYPGYPGGYPGTGIIGSIYPGTGYGYRGYGSGPGGLIGGG